MGVAIDSEMACRALDMAWYSRLPAPGLIFHSDRGSQYASGCYTDLVAGQCNRGFHESQGQLLDNTCSEMLFGLAEGRTAAWHGVSKHRETKDATLEWLLCYNEARMHSTLRYLSPAQFEQQASALPAFPTGDVEDDGRAGDK